MAKTADGRDEHAILSRPALVVYIAPEPRTECAAGCSFCAAEDDIIAPYVEAVEQVLAEGTEQDDQGRIRIIGGVAEDRRVVRSAIGVDLTAYPVFTQQGFTGAGGDLKVQHPHDVADAIVKLVSSAPAN